VRRVPAVPDGTRPVPDGTRPVRGGDEGAALVTVLIALLLFVPLALGTLAIVVQRQQDVVYERSRTVTAHTAEAGIDAATAAIRAAATDGEGTRTALPCAHVARLQGGAGSEAGALRYEVRIRYYLKDPQGRPPAWRDANALACTPGSGVPVTPRFALLESDAAGSPERLSYSALQDRSVESVYRFNLQNENIAGGPYRTRTQNNPDAVNLCWASETAVPAVGSGLVVTTCQDGAQEQMFAYRPDHTIYNTASGLCVTSAGGEGSQVRLDTCAPGPQQRWIYTDNDHLQAVDAEGDDLAPFCLAMAQAYTPGTPLVLSGDCLSPQTMWSPDSRTGPGGAGAQEFQLVNFGQFARCFDVTDTRWDSPFVQLHPCKQSPRPLDFVYQQVTYVPQTAQLRVGRAGVNLSEYCLEAPGPGSDSEYVSTRPCTGTLDQRWTQSGLASTYETSYRIVDGRGRCMTAGPVPPEPNRTFSAIIVAACDEDGSLLQKWNAPAQFVTAGRAGFRETTGEP
jgi:hypothetical protein